MKKLLNNKQIYTIIRAEDELGRSKLIYDLHDMPNAKVYAEVNKRGTVDIDIWELRKKLKRGKR